MPNLPDRFSLASLRATGRRSFTILDARDCPRLEAFLMCFNFDQRRAYFGGGVSDESIRRYCGAVDWDTTTIIARCGSYCLEAIGVLVALPPDGAVADFSVACPLACDQRPIVAELLDLGIEIAALGHQTLSVSRELAHPDLLQLLRAKQSMRCGIEAIELDPSTTAENEIAAGVSARRPEYSQPGTVDPPEQAGIVNTRGCPADLATESESSMHPGEEPRHPEARQPVGYRLVAHAEIP